MFFSLIFALFLIFSHLKIIKNSTKDGNVELSKQIKANILLIWCFEIGISIPEPYSNRIFGEIGLNQDALLELAGIKYIFTSISNYFAFEFLENLNFFGSVLSTAIFGTISSCIKLMNTPNSVIFASILDGLWITLMKKALSDWNFGSESENNDNKNKINAVYCSVLNLGSIFIKILASFITKNTEKLSSKIFIFSAVSFASAIILSFLLIKYKVNIQNINKTELQAIDSIPSNVCFAETAEAFSLNMEKFPKALKKSPNRTISELSLFSLFIYKVAAFVFVPRVSAFAGETEIENLRELFLGVHLVSLFADLVFNVINGHVSNSIMVSILSFMAFSCFFVTEFVPYLVFSKTFLTYVVSFCLRYISRIYDFICPEIFAKYEIKAKNIEVSALLMSSFVLIFLDAEIYNEFLSFAFLFANILSIIVIIGEKAN